MTTLTALTSEQTKRVNNEIADAQRKLNKELAYSQDLQNANRISELNAHITRLNAIILSGWAAPKFN